MMTRRTVLTSGAATAMTAGATDPLATLLDGGGDPGLAVPAWAGVAGPARRDRPALARADGLANIAAR